MIYPMIIRSVALSEDSFDAWKEAGGWYPLRERTILECLKLHAARDASQPIINLGNTHFTPTTEELEQYATPDLMFNHGDNIRPLVRPGTTRVLLGELMPPYPIHTGEPQNIWIKGPGAQGRGKKKKEVIDIPQIPKDWDLQVHISGLEYRAITVRDKVVQAFHRKGDNTNREYEWVGVVDSPKPVKQLAKDAARKLTGNNIIAWDIILDEDDKAHLLEGNSSPGVTLPTAQRIFLAIEQRSYSDA